MYRTSWSVVVSENRSGCNMPAIAKDSLRDPRSGESLSTDVNVNYADASRLQ